MPTDTQSDETGLRNGRCPCCQKPLTDHRATTECALCRTAQHAECWRRSGHCGVSACTGRAIDIVGAVRRARLLSFPLILLMWAALGAPGLWVISLIAGRGVVAGLISALYLNAMLFVSLLTICRSMSPKCPICTASLRRGLTFVGGGNCPACGVTFVGMESRH